MASASKSKKTQPATKPCNYKETCKNFACTFSHPPQRLPVCAACTKTEFCGEASKTHLHNFSLCQWGIECIRFECTRKHPMGRKLVCDECNEGTLPCGKVLSDDGKIHRRFVLEPVSEPVPVPELPQSVPVPQAEEFPPLPKTKKLKPKLKKSFAAAVAEPVEKEEVVATETIPTKTDAAIATDPIIEKVEAIDDATLFVQEGAEITKLHMQMELLRIRAEELMQVNQERHLRLSQNVIARPHSEPEPVPKPQQTESLQVKTCTLGARCAFWACNFAHQSGDGKMPKCPNCTDRIFCGQRGGGFIHNVKAPQAIGAPRPTAISWANEENPLLA
jgi:hypothetical protein